MLKVSNVTKKYKNVTVLEDVSFEVREGEILGLLGPNGAGKSTIINAISGLIEINAGSIEVFGMDIKKNIKEIRQQMGVVPQDVAVVDELSAYENCMFIGGLYGLKGNELKEAVKKALNYVELWDRRKNTPSKFSGGMKRRLNIACALIHKPKLLIMDEPTVGVDPQSRHYILESIRKLNSEGATIIYTSHYMEEVEELCDRVVIIDLGKNLAVGTCEELVKETSKNDTVRIHIGKEISSKEEEIKEISSVRGVIECKQEDEGIIVVSSSGSENLKEIIECMNKGNIPFESINMIKPSLEQVFMEKTGKTLRD